MDPPVPRGLDDLLGRAADAVVNHLAAGVAGAHRDLLGAVGMAVQARLANEQLETRAQALGDRVHPGAQIIQSRIGHVGRARRADAGRRAVFAVDGTQGAGPLAGGDPGMGARQWTAP